MYSYNVFFEREIPWDFNSLNNLFSNMIAFYFPMQRSGACNAFDYFYFINNEDKPRLYDVKYYSKFRKLNDRRKEIIRNLN